MTKGYMFWASWCGPCKAMKPIVAEVEEETGFEFEKIDIDENRELPREYKIMSVPTFLFRKDDGSVDTVVGVKTKQELIEAIEANAV